LIALSFDPSGRTAEAQLAGALAPLEAVLTAPDALRIAHAGDVHAAVVGQSICVLEGELFNRGELSRELRASPETDAATLAALAFSTWDLAGLARLRGTFALAIWDRERRRGLIATDQFALRPWYVECVGDRVRAATSMRALLRMLPSAPQPDPVRTITWVAPSITPVDETFAHGVKRLRGAHAILIEQDRVTIARWWQPRYRDPLRAPRGALVEQVRSALGSALRSRLPPSETAGVILSGGFDSAAVTGVAASEREAPGAVRTYSAGFPEDPGMDESPRVRDLVAARGLGARLLHVQPGGLVRLALEHQRDWGIPCGGPGYLLERSLLESAAADGVRGVLDGQGGDELFGYSPYLMAERVRRGRLYAAAQLLTRIPDQTGRPSAGALRHMIREFIMRPLLPVRLEKRLRLRGDPTRHLPPWVRRDQLGLFLEVDESLPWLAGDGPLWWRHRADLLTVARAPLTEYIAHRGRDLGLQMRPPLLDVDLVELSLQLPPELAYGGINRSLARDSVAGDLPDSVRLAARKSNLQPFYHRSLSGPDLQSIRSLLEPPDARIFQYVERTKLLELLANPPAVGQPGWVSWIGPVWVSVTGEIALRSLENPGFCQEFMDAHDPPRAEHTEMP
jgi:asparagine synthase (glutamine-hydrolysing)